MRPDTWFDALHRCQQMGESYVLITVLNVAGSTPREAGAKMVVTADSQYDTIGGGHLEHVVIAQAREQLAGVVMHGQPDPLVESFPLSAKLGQCCGGAAKILFEVKACHGQHVTVFGAGHVAKALVPLLAQLPLQITWVDSRQAMFDNISMSSNVNIVVDDEPASVLQRIPASSWLLVLTHNHQLDYQIVEDALRKFSFEFVGMIGSDTKARRFLTRLTHRGLSDRQLSRLISPVGDLSIPGKRPVEVAVSITAQLIKRLHSSAVTEADITQTTKTWESHDA